MVSGHEFDSGSTSYFYANSSDPLTSAVAWHIRPSGLQDPLQSSNTLVGSSSALSTVTPEPGSSPGQAFNLGNLNGTRTVSDFVGSTDINDFYRFDLSAPSSLNIALSGLSADANLQLLNSTGTVIASSSQVGNLAESINLSGLTPGTYYAKVYQFSGDTNYNLKLTADLAGNTLSAGRNIRSLSGTQILSDFVGTSDPGDYYQLNLSAPGSLNIALNGLSADANLQLFNSSGTVIASSAQVGNLAESINLSGLAADTYYVRVYQFSGDTNYNLKLTADLAGNTLSVARNIGSLSGTQMWSDFVGTSDPNDYYQLNLSAPGSLNIALNGLSADANLQLFNSSGTLIGSSSQLGNLAESINLSGLAAGTYYVRVYQSSGDTNYTLDLSTSPPSEASQILPGASSSINASAPAVSSSSSAVSSIFSVVDASGDNTPYTVFQGGAIRASYNFQGVTSLSNVRLEALKNGTVAATLGTWNGASLSNALVNLTPFSTLTAGDYQLRAVIHTTTGQDLLAATQAISILPNNRFNGTLAADTFEYSAGMGKGAIFLGRGGTDILDLGAAGISRANIASINGLSLSAFAPLSGVLLSQLTASQAIYGGTAFDYLTLADGREIYFQGIEFLHFADVVGSTLELEVHPNDTYFGSQWNLAVADVPSAWRFTQGASNVLLASLDTGILTAVGSSNGIFDIATNRLITYSTEVDDFNDYGHGHSAISIMAGTANNSVGINAINGIAGINWNSPVYVSDVYGGNGKGARVYLQQAIANAIDYAKANNMKVVFQGGIQGDVWLNDGGTQAQLEQLIQANSDNAIFAIAAGNGGPGGNLVDPNYLTSVSGVAKLETTHTNVISVGALQYQGTAVVNGITNATAVNLASYSNRGSNLTLVAPTDSPAINKSGNLIYFTETSAANPNLAGIASLVWSVNPTLTGGQVRQILTDTAMDLGTTGRDNTFGYGLVDADAAVRRGAALQRNAEVANLYTGSSLLV